MENVNTATIYVIVFATVFLPYMFISTFMNTPGPDAQKLRDRNLPSVFRIIWRPLQLFVEALGGPLADLQPKRTAKFAMQIKVANAQMTPEHVFAAELTLSLAFSMAFILIMLLMTRDAGKLAAAFLLGAFLGFAWPSIALGRAAEKRQTAILKALPFAIDLISSAMRAGIDFMAAVRIYVSMERLDAPLADEFGIMLNDLERGSSRQDALVGMSERICHEAFSAFTDAVVHGQEVGASIVGTMKIQAEELRRVRFNAAERKAARAVSSMIFPIAIFIMPAMFLIIGTPILIRVMASGLGGILK